MWSNDLDLTAISVALHLVVVILVVAAIFELIYVFVLIIVSQQLSKLFQLALLIPLEHSFYTIWIDEILFACRTLQNIRRKLVMSLLHRVSSTIFDFRDHLLLFVRKISKFFQLIFSNMLFCDMMVLIAWNFYIFFRFHWTSNAAQTCFTSWIYAYYVVKIFFWIFFFDLF